MTVLRLVSVLGTLVLALGASLTVAASEPTAAARYFPETRLLVADPFLELVEGHGADLLGPPLTQAYLEEGRLIQWFRNGRLEIQAGRPVLSTLGGYLLRGEVAPPAPPPVAPHPRMAYFAETGQAVGYAILDFYRASGGAAVFGLPLTPQIGNVQWFERARLEWDPTTGTVRLGELGREALADESVVYGPSETNWVGISQQSVWRTLAGEELGTVPAWRAFVALAQDGEWLRVWDPLQDRFGLIEAGAAGPIDPPTWHEQFGEFSRLNLPGRVVRRGVDAPELDGLQHNDPITIRVEYTDEQGKPVYLTENGYELSSQVARIPQAPDRSFSGKWIDVNLSEPVLVTAYEDDRPVYSTLAVKGVGKWQTPTGVFHIWRRVANETMNSETIGIPRDAPEGYYLKDVLFTQYFSGDGAALHYNYWRSDWGYAGSHGCLGLNYDDSRWFWEWAEVTTPIYIHY